MGKREYDDYAEDDEVEYVKKEVCPISDTLLWHLSNCAKTTRLGMVDRGAPVYLAALATLKYCEKVGDGHRVTDEGFVFIRKWHKRLKDIGAI